MSDEPAELGGESACYAHLLDDDGRLIENWKELEESGEADPQPETNNPG